jgi:hypothetical protein
MADSDIHRRVVALNLLGSTFGLANCPSLSRQFVLQALLSLDHF